MSGLADDVAIAFDVPATMRDGVVLRANVYRPAGAGPWPTLLLRTPYRKDLFGGIAWCGIEPVEAARGGFLVVVQDTRGRFASDGEWAPLAHEAADGVDAIAWAARLPGSNGRVGTYGGSYGGGTQWLPALERPPALAAICPLMTWSDPLDGLLARGGALELGIAVRWSFATGVDHLARVDADPAAIEALIDDVDRLGADDDAHWPLPAGALAGTRRHGVPDLGATRALEDPAGARRLGPVGRHERVEVPSFHVGGWHDCFSQGTLDTYMATVAAGRPARLLMGPWTHERFSDPIGELRHGARSAREAAVHPHGDVKDLQLAWLREQLVEGYDAELPEAPVRIFVMGRDVWRDEREWPPARALTERWLLGAGGSLATGAGAAPPSEFLYDPADPVPTVGGPTVMWPAFPAGPCDQAAVEARPDVLVFTSEPLAADLEVTGRVRVVLHAESSAPSTDWVARLCDVHLDGRSYNLCDGIARVAQGADALQRVEIDLWSMSNVFRAGHRLRVHVTSSSFPRWDRNLNTGDQHDARVATARQRVHHDPGRGSWIELPAMR
jgi:putative CocE/NonD family hydrolase